MADPKPPVTVELVWTGELQFGATTGGNAFIADSNGVAGPSPMQLMAVGVTTCMAADIVSILQKGRHPFTALRATCTAQRLPEPPRRFTSITLHFHVIGDVPEAALSRAIDLSRDKYCSAWNSIRTDVTLATTFTITP